MALFKCIDCSHDVSDLAVSCPHCGRLVSTMAPPSPGEPVPSPSEVVVDEPQVPVNTGHANSRGDRAALILVVSLAAVIGLGILITKPDKDRPASADPASATQEQPAKPVSAAELLTMLKSERTAGRPDNALGFARDLINSHGGTPEAKEAAGQIKDLEAAVAVAQEAERDRVTKAEAEAEVQRLAGKWSYSVEDDPMTSRKARYASIQSENALNFDFPYQGEQRGKLLLRDHPSHGRDVLVLIEKGQILCPSYDSCRIRVRFDEGTPQQWSAVGPADNSSTVIFLRNEDGFLQKLRRAKLVRIQIPVYQEGEQMLEFQVGGFSYSRYREGS